MHRISKEKPPLSRTDKVQNKKRDIIILKKFHSSALQSNVINTIKPYNAKYLFKLPKDHTSNKRIRKIDKFLKLSQAQDSLNNYFNFDLSDNKI